MRIPSSLRDRVERTHGAAGREWLAALPAILRECRARWALELAEPFAHLSYNLVLPGRTAAGTEIVLKVGVPCHELLTEAAALELFAGRGAVRLLDHDAPRGLLLLERVTPGALLHEVERDPEATRTAASVMRRLWRTPPAIHSFPSLARWFRSWAQLREQFGGGSGPLPTELLAQAERTFAELNSSAAKNVILHGDLHHANILSSASAGWVAIDPKGICGDAGYEVGSFMLNQLPAGADDTTTLNVLARRLAIFADELQMSRARLTRWAFCHAMLSAAWDFEESAAWHDTIHLARLLAQLTEAG
ncbi:MAG: aminoglycoside phosphotransferase family protein [Pyrinomonadaceae bacterium]